MGTTVGGRKRAEHDCPEYAEKPALLVKRTEPVLLGWGVGASMAGFDFSIAAEELMPCPGGLTSVFRPALPRQYPKYNKIKGTRRHKRETARVFRILEAATGVNQDYQSFEGKISDDDGHVNFQIF